MKNESYLLVRRRPMHVEISMNFSYFFFFFFVIIFIIIIINILSVYLLVMQVNYLELLQFFFNKKNSLATMGYFRRNSKAAPKPITIVGYGILVSYCLILIKYLDFRIYNIECFCQIKNIWNLLPDLFLSLNFHLLTYFLRNSENMHHFGAHHSMIHESGANASVCVLCMQSMH